MNTVPSPKADLASETARSNEDWKSDCSRTTRIPRPPPPIAALMITAGGNWRRRTMMSSELTREAVLLNEGICLGPGVNRAWRTRDDRNANLDG